MAQEAEVKGCEHQDDADVCCQPLPELMPEEQDVHADNNGNQSQQVEHDDCRFSHELTMHLANEKVVSERRQIQW